MLIESGLLSIIVPIYNVEETINRCVESIVKQTYKNIEIILINDASTDESGKWCKEWQLKDNRITFVESKQNKGVAETRNIGLRLARGEYIAFVDSDDYLEITAYEKMMDAIRKDDSDMVICNFWNYIEKTKQKTVAYKLMDCCKQDVLREMTMECLPTAIWGKVIKREIVFSEIYGILWFPKGRRYEDTVITFRQIMRANKISIISEPLYYYIQSETSITAKPKTQDIEDIMTNIDEIKELLEGNISQDLLNCYINSTLIYALQLWYRIDDVPECLKIRIQQEIDITRREYSIIAAMHSRKWKKLLLCKLGLIDYIVKKMN